MHMCAIGGSRENLLRCGVDVAAGYADTDRLARRVLNFVDLGQQFLQFEIGLAHERHPAQIPI